MYLRPDAAALRPRSPAFLRRTWMRVSGGAGPEVELAAFPLVGEKPALCLHRSLLCSSAILLE